MNIIRRIILLSALVLALAACNTSTPVPTETAIPTNTSAPTSTNTLEPTAAPTKTPVPPTETPSKPSLPIPVGTPASEWNGIPIMPNAIAGEGDSKGYSFIINASADEIQQFYETALGKLGWNMFASGQGKTDVVLLFFMKDSDTLSVSLIPQPDGTLYVLLVK